MWFCGPGVQVRRALQHARRSCMRPFAVQGPGKSSVNAAAAAATAFAKA